MANVTEREKQWQLYVELHFQQVAQCKSKLESGTLAASEVMDILEYILADILLDLDIHDQLRLLEELGITRDHAREFQSKMSAGKFSPLVDTFPYFVQHGFITLSKDECSIIDPSVKGFLFNILNYNYSNYPFWKTRIQGVTHS